MLYSGVDLRAQPCLLIPLGHLVLTRLPGTGLTTRAEEDKVSNSPVCLEGESFQLSGLEH